MERCPDRADSRPMMSLHGANADKESAFDTSAAKSTLAYFYSKNLMVTAGAVIFLIAQKLRWMLFCWPSIKNNLICCLL